MKHKPQSQKLLPQLKLADSVRKSSLIQQNQQLRALIKTRLIKDYAHGRKDNCRFIEQEVENFFARQKVTESTLRNLKRKVAEGCIQNNFEREQPKPRESQRAKVEFQAHSPPVAVQNHPQMRLQEEEEQKVKRADDESDDELVRRKDNGMSDQEWSLLININTELYHKEMEIQKAKKAEAKRRNKLELDKQVELKNLHRSYEQDLQKNYEELERKQMQLYDEAERQKVEQTIKKYELEKKLRDRQVKMEHRRKRQEQKREKEMDRMMVQKNIEEIKTSNDMLRSKKELERARLREMMHENELYQSKLRQEQQRQREDEINQQREYNRMVKEIEDKKENDRQQLHEKIKNILSTTDLIVMNQMDEMKEEDERLRLNFEESMRKQKQRDELKKEDQRKNRQEIRSYLDSQILQRQRKIDQEKEFDREQARMWNQDFKEHEQKRINFMRESNQRHKQTLLKQIREKKEQSKRPIFNSEAHVQRLYNKLYSRASLDNPLTISVS